MNVTKEQGIGGEWTTVCITIGNKQYRRVTSPSGSARYANVTNGANASIKSGGKIALKIDSEINKAIG